MVVCKQAIRMFMSMWWAVLRSQKPVPTYLCCWPLCRVCVIKPFHLICWLLVKWVCQVRFVRYKTGKSDCKKPARLNAIPYVLHKLPYTGKDLQQVGKLDPLIVGRAHVVYERGEKPQALM